MKNKGELYAIYIGKQFDGCGGSFDLFNVMDESGLNELNMSTVSLKTILKLKIKKIFNKDGSIWRSL